MRYLMSAPPRQAAGAGHPGLLPGRLPVIRSRPTVGSPTAALSGQLTLRDFGKPVSAPPLRTGHSAFRIKARLQPKRKRILGDPEPGWDGEVSLSVVGAGVRCRDR